MRFLVKNRLYDNCNEFYPEYNKARTVIHDDMPALIKGEANEPNTTSDNSSCHGAMLRGS